MQLVKQMRSWQIGDLLEVLVFFKCFLSLIKDKRFSTIFLPRPPFLPACSNLLATQDLISPFAILSKGYMTNDVRATRRNLIYRLCLSFELD